MTRNPKLDRDKRLLGESIEHWLRMRVAKPNDESEGPYSDDCPLCLQYRRYTEYAIVCGGCPIAVASGNEDCKDTPYIAAYHAWRNRGPRRGTPSWRSWARASQKMIDYLKQLLAELEART